MVILYVKSGDIFVQNRTVVNKQLFFPTDYFPEMMPYLLIILVLVIATVLLLILLVQRNVTLHKLRQQEKIRTDRFRDMTHQLRTPLTIILGLSHHLREVKEHTGNHMASYLTVIERQGHILNNLTNRLLEASKTGATDGPSAWKYGNIVAFMEMVTESLLLQTRKKGIELVFVSEETEIETDFHPAYLQKIIRLFVDKALESSHEGSRIFVIVERQRKKIALKVVDHGTGISRNGMTLFLKTFSRAPLFAKNRDTASDTIQNRHLISHMHASIGIHSSEGKGSIFSILIPIRHDKKNRQADCSFPPTLPPTEEMPLPTTVGAIIEEKPLSMVQKNDPREISLLVEENSDMALYIGSLFDQHRYHLLHATSGTKALEMAKVSPPNVIIADSSISRNNGTELCRELRTSPLLNHIPVIILSSRNEAGERLEILKCGADAFLSKPFRADELQIWVEKLLESRNVMKEKYRRAVASSEKKEEISTQHLDFLREVTDIIHREIQNPNFSPNMLADELAISLSQLNRRLNSVAGKPSSTYILHVKMSHARKILSSQQKTIGEVAAECGIFDVNYFSRIFKKHTGLTPTQYQRLPVKKEG